MKKNRFGFDLDNTLIDYSQSTVEYCKLNRLQIYKSLRDLRNKIKFEMADDESWQSAQAWIYTEGLDFAKLMIFLGFYLKMDLKSQLSVIKLIILKKNMVAENFIQEL